MLRYTITQLFSFPYKIFKFSPAANLKAVNMISNRRCLVINLGLNKLNRKRLVEVFKLKILCMNLLLNKIIIKKP